MGWPQNGVFSVLLSGLDHSFYERWGRFVTRKEYWGVALILVFTQDKRTEDFDRYCCLVNVKIKHVTLIYTATSISVQPVISFSDHFQIAHFS